VGSLVIDNDLLAYFIAGLIHLLIVLKERRSHCMNSKMFILNMLFMVVVALQIVLTF
jgi:hypothetical protein